MMENCSSGQWGLFLALIIFFGRELVSGADVVIQIPENLKHDENATYRLDYSPPYGNPAPNTTVLAREVGNEIKFSKVLAGTMYKFTMYYSNSTVKDRQMYTASITTAPDPPANMLVSVINGTSALVTFEPPRVGKWAEFQLKLFSMRENKPIRSLVLENNKPYLLKDLIPGGTYTVQLFSVYDGKESSAYTQYKFTTRPNPPVSCIVWFRNETTLMLLWQPPPSQQPTIYTHYKVMIEPNDAPESLLMIDKGEPPGPARAIFRDLIPGRPYNISVQTVSGRELSVATVAQYRTSPLPPMNLHVDPASITTSSFSVTWDPPDDITEFEKYQISITITQPTPIPPVMRNKTEERSLQFTEHLKPGHTYEVTAKTVSGKVSSEKTAVNVTLKPLPVKNLQAVLVEQTDQVRLTWKPDNSSLQNSYEISYTEVYNGTILNGDTNFMTTTETDFLLESFLPGRNYSISVRAVSNTSQSSPVVVFQATRPSPPVIEDLKPIEYGLNISWKSDVNSRQEFYEIFYKRNDSDVKPIKRITEGTHLLVEDLYPGAEYNIKIFAVSHGLKSEPHEYFQAVYPKPPEKLTKENVTSNSVTLSWDEPDDSLFSEFSIWLRTVEETKWTKESVKRTSAEISKLKPGECYTIQINSVSFGVESARPLVLNHTVYPSPVTSIAPLVDSTNITVEFPRPEGRIEYYVISWFALDGNEGMEPQNKYSMTHTTAEGCPGNLKGTDLQCSGTVRILVDGLIPGMKYQFEIKTVSYGLTSNPTPFVARTMPIILSELVVVSSVQETNSMTIHYTPTPLNASHFDKYRFSLSDSGLMQEKSINDSDWKVRFTDLVPGKLYNITVWTVSDNVLSQPLYKQDRLYPEPISQINATEITDTIIALEWNKPKGEYDSYEVQYLNSEGKLVQNITTNETCSITNLKPYRNYTFTVVVVSGEENSYLRKSSPLTAVFETQEGVPGMVSDFYPVDIQPRFVSFEWSLPEDEYNGILKEFIITYGLEGQPDVNITSFTPQDFKGTIRDLIPGETYEFKIQAKTKVGTGPEAALKRKMPIFAPPRPSSQIVPTEVCRTSNTIQVRFRKNYFSDINGPIINYTIIVAEDDSKNTSGIEMLSWKDVQTYSVWPPYQVLEPYNPFKNSTIEDFTIGAEERCEEKKSTYCNGPLKAGTVYRVKIRAFTTHKDFTDTDYSFPIQTDRSALPLILGITIPIVFILIFASGIIMVAKFGLLRKKKPKKNINEKLSLSDCILETSKPVKLDKFPAYFQLMSADSDFRFSVEFEQLKIVGQGQPCSAAELPCNRPKNRFTNILPYDHSRFKLQPVDDEEGSDYINANYIPGYNSPREFIVTQGPLPSTKDDFWRMCWESNSRAIVMLTKCIEKGREKCDHYWPEDTNRIFYGDISVIILNQNYSSNWCITELMVQRGEEQRVVRHFHFTTWPDFGVPNPPTILLKFVRTFRERVSHEPRPVIVHCSAGVGRSGTFIAIDRILQSLNHATDYVDIFGIVYQMRKERAHMVQTEQQYICIHECLLAVLQGKENPIPSREEMHQNDAFEGEKQQTDSQISSSDSIDEEKRR